MPRLPQSSDRSRRNIVFVKLVTAVRTDAWNGAGFEGPIYPPGARLSEEELGENPILLECAGPVGSWRRGQKRETLWILWRYEAREWIEIARAQALDWRWVYALREPAIRALHPIPAVPVDPAERGREVVEQLLASIDTALVPEGPAVRALVLTALYDQVAGRIVTRL